MPVASRLFDTNDKLPKSRGGLRYTRQGSTTRPAPNAPLIQFPLPASNQFQNGDSIKVSTTATGSPTRDKTKITDSALKTFI